MVKRISSFTLSLTSILLSVPATTAFAPSTPLSQRTLSNNALLPSATTSTFTTKSQLALSSIPFADTTEPVQQVDTTGKVFTTGGTVSVAASSTPFKAYQVPKAAYGSFDEHGKFIPQDGATRATNCLILPEGLRGQVTRVYDTDEWDRTHPIVVKFMGGNDREGEGAFDVPKTFLMHFDAHEINVVE